MSVVGEPATKEPLSLDELQASVNLRTGRKHVLSILVENKSGVLSARSPACLHVVASTSTRSPSARPRTSGSRA